jgi:hypothetical protein
MELLRVSQALSPAQMGMAKEETQPLPTLRALAFQAFLHQHGLSLLDVALAAGVRLLAVWKVARDLPISPRQAASIRAGLVGLTGVDYRGGITVHEELLSAQGQEKRGGRYRIYG